MSDLPPLKMIYKNYRGEVSSRQVLPEKVWFGSTSYHPTLQWFMTAYDIDKCERRDFAMIDILGMKL